MILTTDLKYQKRNKDKLALDQKIEVLCDICSSTYQSVLNTYNKNHEKFEKDMCRSCALKNAYAEGKRKSHFGDYNRNNLGKSFEDRFGIERSNEIKQRLSDAFIGEKNPMFGQTFQTHGLFKESQRRKGKNLIEIYGDEKAETIREKYSIAASGQNNPMYGRPSPIGSGNGWSGWFNGIYFRSILELSYLVYLINSKIPFENGEMSKYKIDYKLNDIEKTYYCDFVLNDGTFIEIKPKSLLNTIVNKVKFSAAKEKHKEKFIVLTEDDFEKLSFDTIKYYYDINSIKFIERYDKKFKEMLNV